MNLDASEVALIFLGLLAVIFVVSCLAGLYYAYSKRNAEHRREQNAGRDAEASGIFAVYRPGLNSVNGEARGVGVQTEAALSQLPLPQSLLPTYEEAVAETPNSADVAKHYVARGHSLEPPPPYGR